MKCGDCATGRFCNVLSKSWPSSDSQEIIREVTLHPHSNKIVNLDEMSKRSLWVSLFGPQGRRGQGRGLRRRVRVPRPGPFVVTLWGCKLRRPQRRLGVWRGLAAILVLGRKGTSPWWDGESRETLATALAAMAWASSSKTREAVKKASPSGVEHSSLAGGRGDPEGGLTVSKDIVMLYKPHYIRQQTPNLANLSFISNLLIFSARRPLGSNPFL